MSFFTNVIKPKKKIYLTNDESDDNKNNAVIDDINNLSDRNVMDELIKNNEQFLLELDINPAYIIRMIFYIESLYRNDFTIINSEDNLIECISRDCVLVEMIIDLPPRALEKNKDLTYLQIHQKRKLEPVIDINFNRGYIWDTYKNLRYITNNKDKYDLLETYGKDLSKYIGFIKVYVELINRYTNNKFEDILEDLIFKRLKKIYLGLWMMLSKDLQIMMTHKDGFVRDIFDSRQLDKINLGKLFIGYKNVQKYFTRDVTKPVIFNTEYYENKSLSKFYIEFHNTVRSLEV